MLLIFETADEEALEKLKKSGDLGLFLMNTVARFAKRLTMQDIQPTVFTTEEEKKQEQDKQDEQTKEEAKDNITEQQLESTVADTTVADDGAPDLLE